jgi:hypothetical protein
MCVLPADDVIGEGGPMLCILNHEVITVIILNHVLVLNFAEIKETLGRFVTN